MKIIIPDDNIQNIMPLTRPYSTYMFGSFGSKQRSTQCERVSPGHASDSSRHTSSHCFAASYANKVKKPNDRSSAPFEQTEMKNFFCFISCSFFASLAYLSTSMKNATNSSSSISPSLLSSIIFSSMFSVLMFGRTANLWSKNRPNSSMLMLPLLSASASRNSLRIFSSSSRLNCFFVNTPDGSFTLCSAFAVSLCSLASSALSMYDLSSFFCSFFWRFASILAMYVEEYSESSVVSDVA
mmetsp:Transcript_15768/g.39030  ORF Transcript_15768/g.39030 Transcript_15768/m.39030 type:complete len:240 (-) Transcript_15768:3002-3721(-)